MKCNKPTIAVLGGGVIGVSTAILLKAIGFLPHIYASTTPHEIASVLSAKSGGQMDLAVGSFYPAASIVPYSIDFPDDKRHLFLKCQAFFELLGTGTNVIRKQHHYDLFSTDVPPTLLAQLEDSFVSFLDFDAAEKAEVISAFDGVVSGWRTNIWFVEFPAYFQSLVELLDRNRILSTKVEKLGRDFCENKELDGFINCLGSGGNFLKDDNADEIFQLGAIARLPSVTARNFVDSGKLLSYKFHPASGLHFDLAGKESDLYMYPRNDCTLLGGTRQIICGPMKTDYDPACDATTIGSTTIPTSMLNINVEIISKLLNQRVSLEGISAYEGLRYLRADKQGNVLPPRIDATEILGKPLIHCYGFGGAGVAMSWLAAYEAATKLLKKVGEPLISMEETLLLFKDFLVQSK